jgi:hypothetical protein
MTVLRRFPFRRADAPLVLALLLAGVAHTEARAQNVATVRVEENLRAEPQGTIIGRLMEGTALPVVRVDGNWVLVNVQGWVWTQSLQRTERQGFDLTVSAATRENLRAEPSGSIIGRLLEGALLNREEDIPGWTRVSREAWIWGESLELGGDPGSDRAPTLPPASGEWWRSGPGGASVLTGPDGDTLAQTRPGAELAVLARQGNWVRVRLEGWAWAPSGGAADSVDTSVVSNVTAEEVAGDPDSYRGAVVEWELQFVSREEAERVRTDFYEGEPFLLTRASAQGRVFVYVAIPPERLGEVEGLIPLERIRVVGRIRTGAAALTGNPILDLLELTRLRRR